LNKGIDLLVGEHSTGTLCEGGHRGAGYPVRRGAANYAVIRNRQKYRIGQSDACSTFAVHTVASGAVLPIKNIEIDDLSGRDFLRFRPTGTPGSSAGGANQQRNNSQGHEDGSTIHC
jgi:hypothetical protein